MMFKNGKVYHLIYIMAMLTRSSQGQTTGPTVTSEVSIVPGSTSVFSIPKATSINLTSDFISGVVPTPTSSPQPTEIIFITASSSSTSSSIIPSTSVGGSTSVESSKLSASDLGAIIGGCAGGLLLLSIITALFCVRQRRKRAKKEYDLSRGVSASMIFSKDVYKQQEAFDLNNTPLRQQQQFTTNPNDSTVKRYNIDNDKTLIEDEQEVATPPVILYTDDLNQQTNNSTSPLPRQQLNRGVSQASKGARLSKYNFLSQAFSQMRTSYGGQALHGQQNHASEEEPKASFQNQPSAPEPSFDKKTAGGVDRSYHDSMVLSPYEFAGNQYSDNNHKKRYQMYSMYENPNSSSDSNGVRGGSNLTPPPPPHSTSTFFNPSRESTMTVGTLHAPLFHQQHHHNPTPPPFNKNLYTSGVITPSMDRDSIISDVSQYNTPRQETPTATTNTTTTTNNNTSNKPYPYF